MDFDAYLIDKKIDPELFRVSEPEKWQSFKLLFEMVHPNSFTVQKKFLLNDLRRLYHLKDVEPIKVESIKTVADAGDNVSAEPKKPARPVIKRAPVIKKPDDSGA